MMVDKLPADARKGQQNDAARLCDGKRDAAIINRRDEREDRREEKLKSIGQAAALSGCFPDDPR